MVPGQATAQVTGKRRSGAKPIRRGIGSVDYVLILGVMLPAAAFALWAGPRIIRLVYEMACVLVGWPFM